MADAAKMPLPWRIGTLAEQTGVTVRALHHYDALGLLGPSHRSAAGHRLYGRRDIERLQQIRSLRQLGLSLAEIGKCVAQRELSPKRIIELHLDRAKAALLAQQELVRRLESLSARLGTRQTIPIDDFIHTVEATTMSEQYFTQEQQETIARRRALVGAERIRYVQVHAWPQLIAEVKAEMDRGADPSSASVQALARRRRELVDEFTGRDKGIAEGVRRQYQEQAPNPAQRHGMPLTTEMFQFIGRAMKS